MTKFNKFFLLPAFIFTLTDVSHATKLHPIPHNSASLTWLDLASLPGTKYAVLSGDPGKKGFFTVRLKFPADYKVTPHYHAITEYDTIISGTYHLGAGKHVDMSPAHTLALNPGTFIKIPAKTIHYGWTREETILQISGIGPWGAIYVLPVDKTQK